MNVYFDTEFESLNPDAKLISIGLITSDGRASYYAEVNTYDINKCSDFCKKSVLPLLDSSTKLTITELRTSLILWLTMLGPDTVLICDSQKDIVQLNDIFSMNLPPNCSLRMLTFTEKWKRKLYNIGRYIQKQNNLRVHHALDDAIANRLIFSK